MEVIEQGDRRARDIRRVVILGAGYGGLRAALQLERRLRNGPPVEIVLIDRFDYHQITTRLHEIAAGSIPPQAAIIPLTRLLNGRAINFLQASVESLRLDEQRVVTSAGDISYDSLVIALGSESEFFGIPGAAENSFSLKSHDEALRIKAHLENAIALAARETNLEARRSTLTFVISGGGFTGVELAGELADQLPGVARKKGIDPREIDIVVVEAAKDILPGFPSSLVNRARKTLLAKGVVLKTGNPIVRVGDSFVEVQGGDRITTRTLIWAAGVRCSDLLTKSGMQTGVRGRAIVNPFLETVTHLDVYVVGDAALVVDSKTGRSFAPSAQLAVKQGDLVARNIWATITGRRRVPYRPRVLGEVVSLGRREALASVRGIKFSGRVAIWLKEITNMRYLYILGGVSLLRDYLVLGAHPATRAGQVTT